jgi:hypothetical protein
MAGVSPASRRQTSFASAPQPGEVYVSHPGLRHTSLSPSFVSVATAAPSIGSGTGNGADPLSIPEAPPVPEELGAPAAPPEPEYWIMPPVELTVPPSPEGPEVPDPHETMSIDGTRTKRCLTRRNMGFSSGVGTTTWSGHTCRELLSNSASRARNIDSRIVTANKRPTLFLFESLRPSNALPFSAATPS